MRFVMAMAPLTFPDRRNERSANERPWNDCSQAASTWMYHSTARTSRSSSSGRLVSYLKSCLMRKPGHSASSVA